MVKVTHKYALKVKGRTKILYKSKVSVGTECGRNWDGQPQFFQALAFGKTHHTKGKICVC